MDSNIPSKPAYVVISQLARYLRICCNYQDFVYIDPNYLQPDYSDKGLYTINFVATTRPLCIVMPDLTEVREVPEEYNY